MEQLQGLLDDKLPLLKEAGKFSVSATFKIARTVVLFSFINLVLIAYGIYFFFNNDYSHIRLAMFLGLLLIAVAATIYGGIKMYHYVMIDGARIYYDKMGDFKSKYATKVIDKFSLGIDKNLDLNQPINKIVNSVEVFTDAYGKVPKVMLKVLNFLYGKIPMADFASEIRLYLVNNEKDKAKDYLISETDRFFKETIFDQNSTQTVYIILMLNILLGLVLLFLLK